MTTPLSITCPNCGVGLRIKDRASPVVPPDRPDYLNGIPGLNFSTTKTVLLAPEAVV